ncbi:MAG: ribbon-helix-helix protein, CopG family [Candidatus Binataceae bacterium]
MRESKVLSITLPPAMLAQAARLAKKEHRTMSELVREALRRYQREREWDRINAYGAAKARSLGIADGDVAEIVRQFRKERRAGRRVQPGDIGRP